MIRIAKALHLLGLTLFLGSIFGHIALGVLPGPAEDAAAALFARRAIEASTWALTLPGLALLAVTGLFLTLRGGLGFGRRRWLTLHQAIWLLIAVNAALVLVPGGSALLQEATAIAGGTGSLETFLALATRESRFGAVNVALALAAVFLAVLRPRLGQDPRT